MITIGKGCKYRPLVLHGVNVDALLERRLSLVISPLFPQPRWSHDGPKEFWMWKGAEFTETDTKDLLKMAGRAEGETTFVGEEYTVLESGMNQAGNDYFVHISYRDNTQRVINGGYRPPSNGVWQPGRNMPAWMSRWDVTFGKIGAKRVQSITADEARAIGIKADTAGLSPADADKAVLIEFRAYWETTGHKKIPNITSSKWELNPWVWCFAVSFQFVESRTPDMRSVRRGFTSDGEPES